ncbi:hypothetical protein [Parvicella tangerina]|uniref:Uncharacterized protein n=1 Tax=Parvicella tangerina TaxID=2829795 RepID=A0A916JP61_9FLAO|nr:hypothetical protein [Parvicella tangerina]CAG5083554.1 hypothetical protein CRYO30217_02229 [Parvicella tangerina]
MNTTFCKYIFIGITLLLFGCDIIAQDSNIKLAVSGKFTIGTHIPKLESVVGPRWTTSPGVHLSLDPHLKLRWKNSFDIGLGAGGYLNHYNFYQGDFSYDIAFLSLKYEARISKYFKIKKGPFEYVSIGCAAGVSPFSHEVNSRTTNDFIAITESRPKNAVYFSPHIGTYKRDGRFGYSLAIQYSFYSDPSPYIYFNLTSATSESQGSHSGNYIGLNLVVDYDLRKKEKPIEEKYPYKVPDDFNERQITSTKTLKVKQRKIKILIWDHGMIDNDTISLMVNGHPVLANYGLNHSKKKVTVKLPADENTLTMYAHNEGSVKPNTAAVIIKVGLRKYRFELNSSMDQSEQLKIIRQQE